ncbi:MAG TPA: EI24 domain-containing protein, partial [Polyangiaceae bacterium]
MPVLGFWRGFSAVFGALRSLLRLPSAWPYALVPALVFSALETGIVLGAWHYLQPWVDAKLRDPGSGVVRDFGAAAASWLSVALVAALGWLVSAFLTPPLSAPALERIVAVVERDLRAPERSSLGFLAEFWCGMRALLLSLAVTVPLLILLTLLELVVPPLAVITTPLKLLIGALGVAWGLFDYPLTLRGVGTRARFALVRQQLPVVLGFGTAFALLF